MKNIKKKEYLINIYKAVKPGSHKRNKHKINTKTKHDFSSGACEDKTTRIFLFLKLSLVHTKAKPGSHSISLIFIKSISKTKEWSQACDIRIVIIIRSQSKHKPRAEQKAKQRKILVILSSQVPDEKLCFVFVAYAYVARVNQA